MYVFFNWHSLAKLLKIMPTKLDEESSYVLMIIFIITQYATKGTVASYYINK